MFPRKTVCIFGSKTSDRDDLKITFFGDTIQSCSAVSTFLEYCLATFDTAPTLFRHFPPVREKTLYPGVEGLGGVMESWGINIEEQKSLKSCFGHV